MKRLFQRLEKYKHNATLDLDWPVVVSLASYFAVDKKDEMDVHMVYNASVSRGLNGAMWASSFALPTVDLTLRGVDSSSQLGDLDLGEMFLNFLCWTR